MKFQLIGRGHDTVLLLDPQDDEARAWIDERIGPEALRWGKSVAIENRYVADVVEGIQRDGGEVK